MIRKDEISIRKVQMANMNPVLLKGISLQKYNKGENNLSKHYYIGQK